MEQQVTHFLVGFAISSEVEQSSLKRSSIGSTPILNIINAKTLPIVHENGLNLEHHGVIQSIEDRKSDMF